ncbi:hypothetical protein [Pseudarthrobacter sp. S9]|uniref:hypothetical protein n=1 Tax=Pseudarthrobacter sp. S9 TaxID=3418421 RepID=UPI003CFE067A
MNDEAAYIDFGDPNPVIVPRLYSAEQHKDAQSEAWEAGLRHALAWLGLKHYGDVMAKDNPHKGAGE